MNTPAASGQEKLEDLYRRRATLRVALRIVQDEIDDLEGPISIGEAMRRAGVPELLARGPVGSGDRAAVDHSPRSHVWPVDDQVVVGSPEQGSARVVDGDRAPDPGPSGIVRLGGDAFDAHPGGRDEALADPAVNRRRGAPHGPNVPGDAA